LKANKAIKRLSKIEALVADVTERYSSSAVHVRAALIGAQAAFARLKEVLSSEVSSGAEKRVPAKRKKAAGKKEKQPAAKTAKRRAPVRKAAKRKSIKDGQVQASSE